MKTIVLAILLLGVTAYASCPMMVKCSMDGQSMSQEECYMNGLHRSCKYSHDYYGPKGKEHHYVIVECN
jgi:hypothetical protein